MEIPTKRAQANQAMADPARSSASVVQAEGQTTLKGCRRNTRRPPVDLHTMAWLLSGQFWIPLEELAPRWRVEAPDHAGVGSRPAPTPGPAASLQLRPAGWPSKPRNGRGKRPIVPAGRPFLAWQPGACMPLPTAVDHVSLGVIQIAVGRRGSPPAGARRCGKGGAALLRPGSGPGWLGRPCRELRPRSAVP